MPRRDEAVDTRSSEPLSGWGIEETVARRRDGPSRRYTGEPTGGVGHQAARVGSGKPRSRDASRGPLPVPLHEERTTEATRRLIKETHSLVMNLDKQLRENCDTARRRYRQRAASFVFTPLHTCGSGGKTSCLACNNAMDLGRRRTAVKRHPPVRKPSGRRTAVPQTDAAEATATAGRRRTKRADSTISRTSAPVASVDPSVAREFEPRPRAGAYDIAATHHVGFKRPSPPATPPSHEPESGGAYAVGNLHPAHDSDGVYAMGGVPAEGPGAEAVSEPTDDDAMLGMAQSLSSDRPNHTRVYIAEAGPARASHQGAGSTSVSGHGTSSEAFGPPDAGGDPHRITGYGTMVEASVQTDMVRVEALEVLDAEEPDRVRAEALEGEETEESEGANDVYHPVYHDGMQYHPGGHPAYYPQHVPAGYPVYTHPAYPPQPYGVFQPYHPQESLPYHPPAEYPRLPEQDTGFVQEWVRTQNPAEGHR